MAKRGQEARKFIAKTIIDAFGDKFQCLQDKKIYVNVPDGEGGEVLQFAIALSIPKTPVETLVETKDLVEDAKPAKVELSSSDKEAIEDLKRKLGI